MEGTYLSRLPADLRNELILRGVDWPLYFQRLPPELQEELAKHLKGVWFHAQRVMVGGRPLQLRLDNLTFIEPGKRTIVINEFTVSYLDWWGSKWEDRKYKLDNFGEGFKVYYNGNRQGTYSKSIGDLFNIKLIRALLDLIPEMYDAPLRERMENSINPRFASFPFRFPTVAGMYRGVV